MDINLEQNLMAAADWAFLKAISDVPLLGSAKDLAEEYRRDNPTDEAAIDSLVRWQVAKTGCSGFITNIGGIYSLPVAIPADISCLLFHQMRMVAATAYLSGITDLQNDKVKTVCLGCLATDAIHGSLRAAGIQVGKRLAINAIKAIPGKVIIEINKAVGMRLLTKFGTQGICNLGKMVPLVSGAIGAAMNSTYTYSVGKAAKYIFFGNDNITNVVDSTGTLIIQ